MRISASLRGTPRRPGCSTFSRSRDRRPVLPHGGAATAGQRSAAWSVPSSAGQAAMPPHMRLSARSRDGTAVTGMSYDHPVRGDSPGPVIHLAGHRIDSGGDHRSRPGGTAHHRESQVLVALCRGVQRMRSPVSLGFRRPRSGTMSSICSRSSLPTAALSGGPRLSRRADHHSAPTPVPLILSMSVSKLMHAASRQPKRSMPLMRARGSWRATLPS